MSISNSFKLISLALVLSLGVLVSCNSGSTEKEANHEKKEVDRSGPEYTSAYICPMHREGSGSAEEGNCPVCKMDYVANKKHESHQHSADETETPQASDSTAIEE